MIGFIAYRGVLDEAVQARGAGPWALVAIVAVVNHAVLTALMADRSAWRVVESEPAQRPRGYAEASRGMVGGMVAPAYGPDVS